MTRAQAIIISLLAGLVLLVFAGGIIIFVLPYETIFPPVTPTPTLSPTITPTPTLPNFMPTPSLETATPAEPTPTNTRLPTSTPLPQQTATPTVAFNLPTLAFKPTNTPTSPPPPPPPLGSSPTPSPIAPRLYNVSFEANEIELIRGECTDLTWRVQGPVKVWLDGEPVDTSDSRKVCPRRDTVYVLTTQVAGSSEIRRNIIKITVEEDKNSDNQ